MSCIHDHLRDDCISNKFINLDFFLNDTSQRLDDLETLHCILPTCKFSTSNLLQSLRHHLTKTVSQSVIHPPTKVNLTLITHILEKHRTYRTISTLVEHSICLSFHMASSQSKSKNNTTTAGIFSRCLVIHDDLRMPFGMYHSYEGRCSGK